MNFGNAETAAPAAAPAPAPIAKAAESAPWSDLDEDVAVAEKSFAPAAAPAADKPSSQRAEDILAMIRNRQK